MNIDTLSIARDLRATELPAAQAEAIAAAIGRSVTEGVATRSDVTAILQRLDALERAMNLRIDALEKATASRIDSLETTTASRIDSLETTTASQIEALDAKLTSKIDNARSSLLTWLMGVIVATAGVVIAMLKL